MNKEKKILAIGVDGTIRDVHSQFDNWYRRTFIKNDSLPFSGDSNIVQSVITNSGVSGSAGMPLASLATSCFR